MKYNSGQDSLHRQQLQIGTNVVQESHVIALTQFPNQKLLKKQTSSICRNDKWRFYRP